MYPKTLTITMQAGEVWNHLATVVVRNKKEEKAVRRYDEKKYRDKHDGYCFVINIKDEVKSVEEVIEILKALSGLESQQLNTLPLRKRI